MSKPTDAAKKPAVKITAEPKKLSQYQIFKNKVKPPLLMRESALKSLFILSTYDSDVLGIFDLMYDDGLNKNARMRNTIQSMLPNHDDRPISTKQWQNTLSVLETGTLARLSVSKTEDFIKGKKGITAMMDRLSKVEGQKKVIEEKWTPLIVAKAYLTLYQSNFQELWRSTIPDTRYDTLKAMSMFKSQKEYQDIDRNDVIAILNTLQ